MSKKTVKKKAVLKKAIRNMNALHILFAAILVVALILIAVLFDSSFRQAVGPSGLKGAWTAGGYAEDMEIDGRGGGKSGHGDHKHSFTYTVSDDTLTISTSSHGNDVKDVYTFTLDGNTLMLTEESGRTVSYTRE